MRMIDHSPAVAHEFETCTEPECTEVLCVHYRAGLAAGHDYMRATAAGLARVRAAARQTTGEVQER